MDEELRFQLETANNKSDEFATHIDRNILYQVILIFVSVLVVFDPAKASKMVLPDLLSLDPKTILKVVPYLLIFLFIKLGLSLKRYYDLRIYLELKSERLAETNERDKILLFTAAKSAEMFYSIVKYSGERVPNLYKDEIRLEKNIGVFSIRLFSFAFAFLFGLNHAICVYLLYLTITNVYIFALVLTIFLLILVFGYRDFILTTRNAELKLVTILVVFFFVISFILLQQFGCLESLN